MKPSGIKPATFRFVAQHLNHCATAVPNRNQYQEYFLQFYIRLHMFLKTVYFFLRTHFLRMVRDCRLTAFVTSNKMQDKVHPITGQEGPEGVNRCSCSFIILGASGVGGQRHPHGLFTPRERSGTHCMRGWMSPRACLDIYEKSRPHRDSIPRPSSP